jgi:hypothetical protein
MCNNPETGSYEVGLQKYLPEEGVLSRRSRRRRLWDGGDDTCLEIKTAVNL